MPLNKQREHLALGELGEDIACTYLVKKGYEILERRYTNTRGKRLGEVDIIAKQGKTLVFVEVKTRVERSKADLLPEANINRSKLMKISKIANVYLKEKRISQSSYRFDAISILYDKLQKKASVRHLESIFL